MVRRFVSIWFRHLATDWFSLRQQHLKKIAFVLRTPVHGRMVITSVNHEAEKLGINTRMVLADARAVYPDLHVEDDKPDLPEKLLKRIGEWCIRFSPVVSVDLPDGLMIDATGCTHLWRGDKEYVADITKRLQLRGYDVRVSIAGTPAVAWAVARYGKNLVVESGKDHVALLPLPPEGLRFDQEIIERLHKLGLHQVSQFIGMPRSSIRKRFGGAFVTRLDQALGKEIEMLKPIIPEEQYAERLPCLDPILTAKGIEIALDELLLKLCKRLFEDQKGLRTANLKTYRVDGKSQTITIGTNRPTFHVAHLRKLFDNKLSSIEPGLGIELFVLEAPKVESWLPNQEEMWTSKGGLEDERLSELIDRLAARIGEGCIHRYLPAEHYWPERSFKLATALDEKSTTEWQQDKPRPIILLRHPEKIEVTAPIPDYPPMLFIRKGKVHNIIKADGPERIEQEWWLQQGEHRDYYRVEDENGNRYWLFRLGHYDDKTFKWFLHGFFS